VRAYGVIVADKIVAENKLGCVVTAKQSGERGERERDKKRNRKCSILLLQFRIEVEQLWQRRLTVAARRTENQ
jgi:hypothetical protein